VVNADDFGFTPDVNAGIVEAHTRGILTATTLMANGEAFDDAIRLARATPTLDIGCHIVLISGCSVMEPERALPSTVGELLAALALGRRRVYDEMAAQVRRILDAGIQPTHLDTHKHTHLAPPVLEALARVSETFRIPWVRRPFDFPLTGGVAASVPWTRRAASRGLGLLRRRFHDILERHHCRTTEHFAGFQMTGRFRAAELVRLLRHLPVGVTEFMCHPGHLGTDLRRARTRLKQSRAEELAALTAPEVRQALRENAIELVCYRDL